MTYCNVNIDGNVVDAKASTCEHHVIEMLLSLDLMLEAILIEKMKEKKLRELELEVN